MLILQLLKWILWIVIWIVLVILLLLLLVLLVPVRYRLEGEYSKERKRFLGRISWLLSLVSITVQYENSLVSRVKILGITIYDSSRPSKPKKKRKKKKKAGEKQKHMTAKGSACKKSSLETKEPDDQEAQQEPLERKEENNHPRDEAEQSSDQNKVVWESIKQEQISSPSAAGQKTIEQAETKEGFWGKLKGWKKKLFDTIEKIKTIWRSFENKLDLVKYYYHMWKKEEIQNIWTMAKKRFGKAFFSIVPRKWTVTGDVGFDDPSTTGQMMAMIGITYPIHGGNLQIRPDFEESRIEIKAVAKGKVTAGIILHHLLLLICHKDCRALIKLLLAGTPTDEQDKNNENNDNSSRQEVNDDRQ